MWKSVLALVQGGLTKIYPMLLAGYAALHVGAGVYQRVTGGLQIPTGYGLAHVVGILTALGAGAFAGGAIWHLLHPRKRDMEWAIAGAAACGIWAVIGLWLTNVTQAQVEAWNPRANGEHWAFYLVPRDAKVLGEAPVEPTIVNSVTAKGWTLVPYSTRTKTGPDGVSVYQVTNTVTDNKALAQLARLQSLADDRWSNPLNSGWTDQVTGKIIPWRFFVRKTVEDGKAKVGLTRVYDRHQAFGPDGEKVFDISLYPATEQAVVKRAFAAQSKGS